MIFLSENARHTVRKHGESAFPDECCGFLYGKLVGDARHISEARPVANSKDGDQRRRFEIHPSDYMQAELYAVTHDLDFLGIYHSHPNHPAIASVHDLEKAMPFFSYLIVSIMDGIAVDEKSWRLKDDIREFWEEPVLTHKIDSDKADFAAFPA